MSDDKQNNKKKAVVIGAGIGGIATSIRLACKGYKVELFEANEYPGGKITAFELDGFRFDAGPSLFTMPHLIDELFTLAGKNPKDYFTYHSRDIACRYFWDDGIDITAWSKSEDFAKEVEDKIGVSESLTLNHLKKSEKIYNSTAQVFLEKSLHKWSSYFQPEIIRTLSNIFSLDLFTTMHDANVKQLNHPKLVQLFDRFATYNGSSPYLAPGILNIIPHLEHNMGSFAPDDGMHSIILSLEKLALDLGVEFYYSEKVQKITHENNRVTGIVSSSGKYESNLIFSNSDIVPTYRNLLADVRAPEKILKRERSSSALIFYWGVNREFPQLDLHNIFFANDYEKEFDHLFKSDQPSEDITVYVNITSKVNRKDAPQGCENWFVMVNVPSDQGQNWKDIADKLRSKTIKKLSAILNCDLENHIVCEQILDPKGIETNTNSFRGSLYGSSSNDRMAAFFRHPNFSSKLKGLYFCGGSVHPGGGIPLCLLSAKIATNLVDHE